jgi:hypothetical protein
MSRLSRRSRGSASGCGGITVHRGAFVCASCRSGLMRRDARVCEDCGSTSFIFEDDATADLDVEVCGGVTPFFPARTNCPVELSHPDEGGEVEDIEATVDGEPFTLTDEELCEAMEEVAQKACEDYDDRESDYGADAYDMEYDR